jgi:hypothetical protein
MAEIRPLVDNLAEMKSLRLKKNSIVVGSGWVVGGGIQS